MSRVYIVNRTPKTFVVNSLNVRILPDDPSRRRILRDGSIANDPDIMELVATGQIMLVPEESVAAVPPPQPAAQPQVSAQAQQPQSKGDQRHGGKRRKKDKQRGAVATSHEDPNSPANQMGNRAIVMGENGPQEVRARRMDEGGPKFVGDTPPQDGDEGDDGEEPQGEFIKIE